MMGIGTYNRAALATAPPARVRNDAATYADRAGIDRPGLGRPVVASGSDTGAAERPAAGGRS
jgi:hypothetical protein